MASAPKVTVPVPQRFAGVEAVIEGLDTEITTVLEFKLPPAEQLVVQ